MSEVIGLTGEADDYFRTLPGLIYPQALVNYFPRIANKIVDLRYDPPHLEVYFDSLLNDRRGDRQGFPHEVLRNIHHLRERILGDWG